MEAADWLRERSKGIGGSDAAAVLGLNPYMPNVELWEVKTGRRKQADISDKDCVRYGVSAEPHIRELFKLDYPELEITHTGYLTVNNGKYPFIRGSFDAEAVHKKTNTAGVIEFKTSSIKNSSMLKKWDNQIPQNYYIQVLHYMLVREAFEFAVLRAHLRLEYAAKENKFTNQVPVEVRDYFIDRADAQVQADLKYLLEKEIEFWRYVETDTRPPLILPEI